MILMHLKKKYLLLNKLRKHYNLKWHLHLMHGFKKINTDEYSTLTFICGATVNTYII